MHTWIVLLPPLLVIISAIITRRIITSFMLGILSSTLIITHGNIVSALQTAATRLWDNSGLHALHSWESFWQSWNLLIFLFLIILGVIITALNNSGAAHAFTSYARKWVTSKKRAEVTTLLIANIFAIDDYFSTFTVGSVMRPLGAACGVSSLKLAFLIAIMAPTLALLCPISSWIGEINLQLHQAGVDAHSLQAFVSADPIEVYLRSIPYLLYALFAIAGAWYIVLRRISYGPMALAEAKAVTHDSTTEQVLVTNHARMIDFILPIASLAIFIVTGLLITGGYHLFGGTNSFAYAFTHAAANQAFFGGGICALILSMSWLVYRNIIQPSQILSICYEGFMMMAPSILMLINAWALGSLLKHDLHTGAYIAQFISTIITPCLFPAICFIFSALIAWMIGSAWATIGLMTPLVLDMARIVYDIAYNASLDHASVILPIIGATLSGCVAGTNISFISENLIMASISTRSTHLDLVKAMIWYVIPMIVGTITSFVLLGVPTHCWWTSLPVVYAVGIIVMCILYELLHQWWKQCHPLFVEK